VAVAGLVKSSPRLQVHRRSNAQHAYKTNHEQCDLELHATQTMRHLPFLQELARHSEESREWTSLALAYRALTLIDVVRDEGSNQNVRDSIASLLFDARQTATDSGIAAPVVAVGELLHDEPRRDQSWDSLSQALLDLAEALRRLSRFELALDASRTALQLSAANDHVAWRAHRDCGHAERMIGRFDSAISHYSVCIQIGRTIRTPEPVFWGRRGIVSVIVERGNLPRAERFARRLVNWVCRYERPALEAVARNGFAIVLGLRGKFRESLEQFEVALPLASGIERDRILCNIAVAHLYLGEPERARNLHFALITHPDSYTAWRARVNLIDVYLTLGETDNAEAECRYLEACSLPPELEIDFRMSYGRAMVALGNRDSAARCFTRAAELSHRFGYGRYLIEADRQIEMLSEARPAMPIGSVAGIGAAVWPSELPFGNQLSRLPGECSS
jgi:tetratricopeptide (TPR) repeat protein